jgi:azurin
VYLPRGLDNSSGGQCFAESDRWGPLGGHLIHFSCGAGNHFLVLREHFDDNWQGAAVPLPGDFLSGVQNGRINPKDGQLYVSGLFGWTCYTINEGCFQRVRYTGGRTSFPIDFETHANGVLLKFNEKLDATLASDAKNHFAQCWNYFYSAGYGSPEFSLRHPGVIGHDTLQITSAHVLADGKTLFLEIPQINPAHTIYLHVTEDKDLTTDVYVSAHQLRAPFADFPGYKEIAKIPLPPAPAAVFVPPPAKSNPWKKKAPGRAIEIETILGLQYVQKELKVKAGEALNLTFHNPDMVPHNWVLLKPGTLQTVGTQVNALIADPKGLSRHYVPDTEDVLVYVDMTNPGGKFIINFNAPKEPGDYPYMCTFPGHWQVMNGVMHVVK